jgi:hypothetical protein
MPFHIFSQELLFSFQFSQTGRQIPSASFFTQVSANVGVPVSDVL